MFSEFCKAVVRWVKSWIFRAEQRPVKVPGGEESVPLGVQERSVPLAGALTAKPEEFKEVEQPQVEQQQVRVFTANELNNIKEAKKRGVKRWSKLLTATKSRVGHTNGLRARLGKRNWQAFTAHATKHYKVQYVAMFESPMRCSGRIGEAGMQCPNNHAVDPTVLEQVKDKLAGLHLDHSYEVFDICTAWKAAMPQNPRTWDDGVDGDLVCHLLFGVTDHSRFGSCADKSKARMWKANLHFRCGPSQQQRAGHFCHETWYPHQEHQVGASMLSKA